MQRACEDAPPLDLVEEFGSQLGLKVVNLAERDEHITLSFRSLPLRQALARLSPRHVVFDGADGDVEKLYLLRRGTGQSTVLNPDKSRSEARRNAEPFKFQFDPARHVLE